MFAQRGQVLLGHVDQQGAALHQSRQDRGQVVVGYRFVHAVQRDHGFTRRVFGQHLEHGAVHPRVVRVHDVDAEVSDDALELREIRHDGDVAAQLVAHALVAGLTPTVEVGHVVAVPFHQVGQFHGKRLAAAGTEGVGHHQQVGRPAPARGLDARQAVAGLERLGGKVLARLTPVRDEIVALGLEHLWFRVVIGQHRLRHRLVFPVVLVLGIGRDRGIAAVHAVVIAGVGRIGDEPPAQQVQVENPVAADAHALPLGVVQQLQVARVTEYRGTDVGNDVLVGEGVRDRVVGRLDVGVPPLVGIDVVQVLVDRPALLRAAAVHEHRARVSQLHGLVLEKRHQRLEHVLGAPVVAFGDPDDLAAGHLQPPLPLVEHAAGIGVVDHQARALRVPGGVLAQDVGAAVRGGVVQQDYLEVLVGLRVDRIQPQAQVVGVVVVRHDHADQRAVVAGFLPLLVNHRQQQAAVVLAAALELGAAREALEKAKQRAQGATAEPGEARMGDAQAVVGVYRAHMEGCDEVLERSQRLDLPGAQVPQGFCGAPRPRVFHVVDPGQRRGQFRAEFPRNLDLVRPLGVALAP